MRIVFIRSNPVSPDSRVEKEVNTLVKSGYDVHILAWDREADYTFKTEEIVLKDTTCLITRFGIKASFGGGIKKNMKPLLLFQLAIYRWLKKHINDYDVIHACDFDTAFTASKVARKYNKKLVYDIFDYYVDGFTVPEKLKRLIERQDINVINQASHTIICTEKRRKQIAKANPKQLTVIHNTPHDLSSVSHTYSVDKSKLTVAYIGILQEGRMIKELVNIIAADKKMELHIGGFGKLEDFIKEKSMEHDNIHFYGKLPYENTLQLEKSCDIITALYDPSSTHHFYAAPNKFYEALMLGKPLIMARNTGLDSIVSDNQFGKVIEFNQEGLKTALNNLLLEKHLFPAISLKMKNFYKENFSWEEMETRLLLLYKGMEEKDEENYGSLWNKTRGDKDVSIS